MMVPILPGATIGILGGGQLGRMVAMSARSLGYRVRVMDPDPSCPAGSIVDRFFEGSWDDAAAAANLARGSDVVTLEIEQVSLACLRAAERFAPVRPGIELMRIVQDRITQKNWLATAGLPVGPYAAITSLEELEEAARALGPELYVKSARGGYDGRSQVKLRSHSRGLVEEAWTSLGGQPCIAEQGLKLTTEISVMVARSPQGETCAFPSARSHHDNQILTWSILPSSIPATLEVQAQKLALQIADGLQLEGLLAVEMFLTDKKELLINELAPRPHNSYHASERACSTSQFEQSVRAICGLPLGDVEIIRPAAIANLLGNLWEDHAPHFDRALRVPGVHLHLYEKKQPRKGRKMGHLSSIGRTPEEALERVLTAMHEL